MRTLKEARELVLKPAQATCWKVPTLEVRPCETGDSTPIDLSDLADMQWVVDEREILLNTKTRGMQVRIPGQARLYASIEAALPGGREAWALVAHFVHSLNATLWLSFLPKNSVEMAAAANAALAALEHTWGEDWEDNEDAQEEQDWHCDQIMSKHMLQLELRGSYEIYLGATDGENGEYVRRGKASECRAMRLKIVEMDEFNKVECLTCTERRKFVEKITYHS